MVNRSTRHLDIDLGLLSLQNCEKWMPIAVASQSMVFCYGNLS